MKLPNGYGSVTKLKGSRRKPWIAKEGKSGKQKPIGYAATREEALIILAKYNEEPWDIQSDKIKLDELYQLWLEKRAVKLSAANQSVLKSAYGHISNLKNTPYRQIKAYQMQSCIDDCGLGHSTQSKIKGLFWHLDKFALELDIINKSYSTLLTTCPAPESNRESFTDDEIQKCWNNTDTPWVDSVLFLLYSGWRFSEFLNLQVSDIDWQNKTMVGGIKTEAGKNRIVPIHSKVQIIVENRMRETRSGYLFEYEGERLSKSKFRRLWASVMESLGIERLPHECRHTFRSRLDSAGANKVCIDRLMGHKSNGTGERVYTHKTIEELKENIELLN